MSRTDCLTEHAHLIETADEREFRQTVLERIDAIQAQADEAVDLAVSMTYAQFNSLTPTQRDEANADLLRDLANPSPEFDALRRLAVRAHAYAQRPRRSQ